MCGIAQGRQFSSKKEKGVLLIRMLQATRHRRLDATEIYTIDIAGLGHAGLSIIDLSDGLQPIQNENRMV